MSASGVYRTFKSHEKRCYELPVSAISRRLLSYMPPDSVSNILVIHRRNTTQNDSFLSSLLTSSAVARMMKNPATHSQTTTSFNRDSSVSQAHRMNGCNGSVAARQQFITWGAASERLPAVRMFP